MTIHSLNSVMPAIGHPWWVGVVTSPFGLYCMILASLSAVIGVVCFVTLAGLRRRQPALPSDSFLKCERGTATLEFALVFPILLFVILMLTQTALAMVGNLFVNYAAFCATRSAIVQIPADYTASGGEGPNVVTNSSGYTKYDLVHKAAVFALVPVAGSDTGVGIDTDSFTKGLTSVYASQSKKPPVWIGKLMAGRLAYAYNNTDMSFMVTSGSAASGNMAGNVFQVTDPGSGAVVTFGPRDPISVQVHHKLFLPIYYVRAAFVPMGHDTSYSDVTAMYTLTNEGIVDKLPDPPALPRDP